MGLFGTVDSYDNKGPVGGATNPLTGAALARDRENQRAILELDGTQAYENITILDGSISPKRAEIIVDTEDGASADTLETILTNTDESTTLHDGMKLTLRSADPSRTVTVKHSGSEFGIQMVDGQDVILGTKWGLKLKLSANKWYEDQGRADDRTNPATTTSRGITRVATLADMGPDAVIENGPAVLAAGSEAVTTTPTPKTIMLRDEAGRVRAEDPVHDKDVANKTYVDNSLIWVVTGSITLNGTTDNTVVMTDIVPELDLEVGDVIRIDAGEYNKLHTVETITNNKSIIVNYEHAGNRGDGSLKLPDFTGQATVTRIAKWFNAPIGIGQEWVDVIDLVTVGAIRTNSTGRTMQVFAHLFSNSNTFTIEPGGLIITSSGGTNTAQASLPIPNNWSYKFTKTLAQLSELR